jgi:tetratricopeptide (TPR) repeat protein
MLISLDHFYDEWIPTDTLLVATLATRMSERIANARLQARSWRELAIAQRQIGRYAEAARALDIAHEFATLGGRSSYEVGLVQFARAALAVSTDRPHEALKLLDQSAAIFAASGDAVKGAAANEYRLLVEFNLGQFEDARQGWTALLEAARAQGDEKRIAIHSGNVAVCCTRLGKYEEARAHFSLASASYDRLGLRVPRARMMRSLARIEIRQNGAAAGIDAMEAARAEFERLRMAGEVIRTELALMEELLEIDEREEAISRCRKIADMALALGLDVVCAMALAALRAATQLTPAWVRELHDRVDASLVFADEAKAN